MIVWVFCTFLGFKPASTPKLALMDSDFCNATDIPTHTIILHLILLHCPLYKCRICLVHWLLLQSYPTTSSTLASPVWPCPLWTGDTWQRWPRDTPQSVRARRSRSYSGSRHWTGSTTRSCWCWRHKGPSHRVDPAAGLRGSELATSGHEILLMKRYLRDIHL